MRISKDTFTERQRHDLVIAPHAISLAYAIGTMGSDPDDMGCNKARGIDDTDGFFTQCVKFSTRSKPKQDPYKSFINLCSSEGRRLYNEKTGELYLNRISFPVYGRSVKNAFWAYDLNPEVFGGYRIFPLFATYSESKERAPFGYIALGTHDNLLVFKGSQGGGNGMATPISGILGCGANDWNQNGTISLYPVPRTESNVIGITVHRGFYELYKSMRGQIFERLAGSRLPLVVMGHSLGGGVASIAALLIKKSDKFSHLNICLYTFGVPPVGNELFYIASTLAKRQAYEFFHFGSKNDPVMCPAVLPPGYAQDRLHYYIDEILQEKDKRITRTFYKDPTLHHYFGFIYYAVFQLAGLSDDPRLLFRQWMQHIHYQPKNGTAAFLDIPKCRERPMTITGLLYLPCEFFTKLVSALPGYENNPKCLQLRAELNYDFKTIIIKTLAELADYTKAENNQKYFITLLDPFLQYTLFPHPDSPAMVLPFVGLLLLYVNRAQYPKDQQRNIEKLKAYFGYMLDANLDEHISASLRYTLGDKSYDLIGNTILRLRG